MSAADAGRLFAAGLEHQRGGRLPEAKACYEQGLRLSPGQPDASFLLGQLLFETGERGRGEALMRQAIAAQPRAWNYWRGLAIQLFNVERRAEARDAFALATALNPENGELFAELAAAQESLGDTEAALHSLVQAATLLPDDAPLRVRLAQALLDAQLLEAGLEQWEAASQLAPENVAIHFQRAAAYARLGKTPLACGAYEAALQIEPDAPPILANLANQYALLGRNEAARQLYERALRSDPDFAPAHFNLGMLLIDEGRRVDAEAALSRACALAPENGLMAAHLLFQRMHLCRWPGLAELAEKLVRAVESDSDDIPPFIVLSMPGTTPALQRRCAENHSRRLAVPSGGLRARAVSDATGRRLRLGYLSSDFKNHATAYLMIAMLEAHDRTRFEVFGLSYGVDDASPLRARLLESVEHFVELAGLPSPEAAARIAALDLDILIDLKGYTEGNHSEWLQHRLAPVQINWLGYPGTLGAPWVDYLIADPVVAPMAHQAMFSERLLHLPGCYQPNCRTRPVGKPPTRAEEGLPEAAIVLCSFNQTYKITPEMFALWLSILHQVPTAVLWLWASNPWAEDALRRVAEAGGIASNRLIFAEGKPQAEHLARLPLADLALDTFPCNGHTTTSDALWAGVPVVTLQGEAFAARVASSLLVAAELPELVASTAEDYAATVIRLCQNLPARQILREQTEALRTTSALFDAPRFARGLETLLLSVWAENAGRSGNH